MRDQMAFDRSAGSAPRPAGCSGSSQQDDETSTSAGLLSAADMPFDPSDSSGTIGRPPPLTQLGTSCIGIEQGVLYDAGWQVQARNYFDLQEWTVISAVFIAPDGDSGTRTGLAQLRQRFQECGDDRIAQVGLMKLPGSASAKDVLRDLLTKL